MRDWCTYEFIFGRLVEPLFPSLLLSCCKVPGRGHPTSYTVLCTQYHSSLPPVLYYCVGTSASPIYCGTGSTVSILLVNAQSSPARAGSRSQETRGRSLFPCVRVMQYTAAPPLFSAIRIWASLGLGLGLGKNCSWRGSSQVLHRNIHKLHSRMSRL